MIARILAAIALALVLAAPAPAAAQKYPAPGAAMAEIGVASLPPEARETLRLIRKGGPYPYARDGITFSNREGLLPKQKRGYYREYTVKTPGDRTRGARRIVTGAAGELYYSDDHYQHLKRIRE
ncbi:MAG TPA: ribonuclease domain-containing protein [Usitatibacter sp.]|nr:ribonuclease domain-containing protein [Usitatibacter sp.]